MSSEGELKFAFFDRLKNGVRESGECLFCGGKKLSIRVGIDKHGKEVWTEPGCSTAECQTNKYWREHLDVLNKTMDIHEELKRKAMYEAQQKADREYDDMHKQQNRGTFNENMRKLNRMHK